MVCGRSWRKQRGRAGGLKRPGPGLGKFVFYHVPLSNCLVVHFLSLVFFAVHKGIGCTFLNCPCCSAVPCFDLHIECQVPFSCVLLYLLSRKSLCWHREPVGKIESGNRKRYLLVTESLIFMLTLEGTLVYYISM